MRVASWFQFRPSWTEKKKSTQIRKKKKICILQLFNTMKIGRMNTSNQLRWSLKDGIWQKMKLFTYQMG